MTRPFRWLFAALALPLTAPAQTIPQLAGWASQPAAQVAPQLEALGYVRTDTTAGTWHYEHGDRTVSLAPTGGPLTYQTPIPAPTLRRQLAAAGYRYGGQSSQTEVWRRLDDGYQLCNLLDVPRPLLIFHPPVR